MTRTTVDRSDALVFHTMPAESDTAIVAFSNKLLQPDRFHFYNLMEGFPNASRLLIRDPRESWYNAGLAGVGETTEEIVGWMRRKLSELGAKRVVAIGTSMGGYAAILFGCMVGAERVVALAPQTLLDRRLPDLVPPAEVEVQVPDLKPVISGATTTAIDVVVGQDSLLDAFHSHRVAGVDSVRLLGVPRSGHFMAKKLNREGKLGALIGQLCDGAMPSSCELEPVIGRETVELIGNGLFAWRKDWPAVKRALAPVAERYPRWPAPLAALARASGELTDWDGLRAALEAALQGGPSGTRLQRRIEQAAALAGKGHFEDARGALGGLMEC